MSAPDAPDFVEWSNERYAAAGVAELMLHLQDEFELDVNMLLWCGWCAEHFADLPDLALKKAMDATQMWSHEVAARLRAVRRSLRSPPSRFDAEAAEALRCDVRDAELKSERLEQAMLAALAREALTAFPDPLGALPRARRNLTRYAALAGAVRRPGFTTLAFDALASRMFPYADERERMQA